MNLKYAVDKNLITSETYNVHRTRYKSYRLSYIDYKPCSLMGFSKRLKSCSNDHQNIDQSFLLDQYTENKKFKTKKSIINISENNNVQKETAIDLNEYFIHKEQESNQIEVHKKSKKKRRKKKKLNGSIYYKNTEETVNIDNEYHKKIEDSSIQNMAASENAVKIFVRNINKKYKNETVHNNSDVSTKKSVRAIFSRIVKQLKIDRQLQC